MPTLLTFNKYGKRLQVSIQIPDLMIANPDA